MPVERGWLFVVGELGLLIFKSYAALHRSTIGNRLDLADIHHKPWQRVERGHTIGLVHIGPA